MAFQPLKEGSLSSALFGTADPSKFVDVARKDVDKNYYEKKIHATQDKGTHIQYTIIIIIISAIIFVTVISIYDIFRSLITNFFAKEALTNPKSQNTQIEIERTLISNQDALYANIWFALFCLLSAIILIWILIQFIY